MPASIIGRFSRSFLTASVFVQRAYTTLEQLSSQEYLLRSKQVTKQLVEEIAPLAALLKHLERPDLGVHCRVFGGNSGFDAQIRFSGRPVEEGFLKPLYFVEVTCAVAPNDYLHREALATTGTVFGGDDIGRTGSRKRGDAKIVSKPVAVDMDAHVTALVPLVREALRSKSAKSYPAPCILLVNTTPDRPMSISDWARVAKEVAAAVDRQRFVATYLVDWYENVVISI